MVGIKATKSILLTVILLCFAASNKVLADTKKISDEALKLKSFVESGISYIKKVGPKKAYVEFNNPKGKFRHDDIYLFAYDYNGKCLAHGFTPNRVGKIFLEERDKYGTQVVKMVIHLAKTGGGFISYYWPSPKTSDIQFKTSYIKPVGDNTFVGSGIYKALDVPKSQLIKLEELKAFVNSGTEYFKKNGGEKAFKEFDDPKGKFRRDNIYMFVFNYKGNVLAHGGDSQKYVGENLYNEKDEFGTPFVQLFIQAAKSGEGMVSYYWQEPTSKKIKLKISYIKPLNKDYFIGAGIYEQ